MRIAATRSVSLRDFGTSESPPGMEMVNYRCNVPVGATCLSGLGNQLIPRGRVGECSNRCRNRSPSVIAVIRSRMRSSGGPNRSWPTCRRSFRPANFDRACERIWIQESILVLPEFSNCVIDQAANLAFEILFSSLILRQKPPAEKDRLPDALAGRIGQLSSQGFAEILRIMRIAFSIHVYTLPTAGLFYCPAEQLAARS